MHTKGKLLLLILGLTSLASLSCMPPLSTKHCCRDANLIYKGTLTDVSSKVVIFDDTFVADLGSSPLYKASGSKGGIAYPKTYNLGDFYYLYKASGPKDSFYYLSEVPLERVGHCCPEYYDIMERRASR